MTATTTKRHRFSDDEINELYGRLPRLIRGRWPNRYAAFNDQDELMSSMSCTIADAINNYKADRGSKLESFVMFCIDKALWKEINRRQRSLPTSPIDDVAGYAATPDFVADCTDSRDAVENLLDGIRGRPRRVLMMLAEGYSHVDIGIIEGIDRRRVGRIVAETRQLIRQREARRGGYVAG